MKKFLVLLLALCFCLGVLTACASEKTEESNTEMQETEFPKLTGEELAEKYDLNSEKIIITLEDGTGIVNRVIEITDPSDVETIISSVDFPNWENTGSGYEGLYTGKIIFVDTGTCIVLGDGYKYAAIGVAEVDQDGKYSLIDEKKTYYDFDLPQGLTQTFNEMVEKYSK
jgi:hypothetical protein